MIQDFISEIKRGAIARTNRYAVFFTPPVAIDGEGKPVSPDFGAGRKILMFCDSAQLPGINISTTQNRTYGEFREIPYEKLFDNVTLSFYVDQDMKVKQLFDEWVNGIQNPKSRTFNYYNNYTTKMTIDVQDINDKTRYTMTLHECYPKTISNIQLDASSKDIMKMSVSMQYKYWTSSTVSVLNEDSIIKTQSINSYTRDFSGYQRTLNRTLIEQGGDFLNNPTFTLNL